MSTIFQPSLPPSPVLNDTSGDRVRGLHKNCLLAAHRSPSPRCVSPSHLPPTSNYNDSSPNAKAFHSNTNTPVSSAPPSYTGSDYFNLTFSLPATPLSTPATPLLSPATPAGVPQIELRLPASPSPQVQPHPTISLQPVIKADAEPVATLFERAFSIDPLRLAIKPPHKISPSDPFEERRWRTKQYEFALLIPDHRIVKAVDTSNGEIVGAACFLGPRGIQCQLQQREAHGEEESLPSHWDRKVHAQFQCRMKKKRESILQGRCDIWELAQLFVDPDYQRQGIGKMLLEWGLKQVDEEGYPVYIEGAPPGKGLYAQMGFQVVSEEKFSDVIMGEEGYKMYFMMRQPQKA